MKHLNSATRPALRTYPIKVKKKIQETKDSCSFVFEIPEELKDLFIYTPAQFLTFNFFIKEEAILRSYSLSSCPLLNEELKTTVKRVKGGVVSNYMIDYLKPGDTVLSRKPAGRFFKPAKDLKPKHYFLFAGGSGITPLFSIIKTALISDLKNKVSLLYANKDPASIIYHKELKDWSARYQDRFHITHILSQANPSWNDFYGRLNTKYLEKYFLNQEVSHPDHLYYLCGPVGFMEVAQNFLTKKQVQKTQIRKESFFTSTQKTKLAEHTPSLKETSQNPTGLKSEKHKEVILTGKKGASEEAQPEIIQAILNKETFEIKAMPDIPILEQLLSAGHSPPFSCLSGSCMSCLAVLKKGRIYQEEKGILEEENIENHEILTCQAVPNSRLVQVDYDT